MSTPLLLHMVEVLVACFFIAFAAGYSVLLVRAVGTARAEVATTRRRSYGVNELAASATQPTVTIIVPAHQEQESIVASVRSLLAQRWNRLEVIVVPNGCTDATADRLRAGFDLRPTAELLVRPPGARARIDRIERSAADPRLWVIETSGGGKADAVNCALDRASGEFCLLVDADSLLAPHAVARSLLPFIEHGDDVAAVSATIRVLNGARVREDGSVGTGLPRSMLARMQLVEYARAFHIGRAGWASLGALPVISGAFGMFRTSVLRAAGGLDTGTVGEDLELVLRLHARVRRCGRRPRIEFLPEPLCWTEVPEDVATLRGQRIRWHRGLVEAVQLHGDVMFNPRHGRVGLLSLPFLGLLELLAPLVELVGLAALLLAALTGTVSWFVFAALVAFAISFGMALSMSAVLLEQSWNRDLLTRPRDVGTLAVAALVEQLGHRQRSAIWRLRGLASGMRPRRSAPADSWGHMRHRGARDVVGS